ncbi:MAG: threonylcarbamoyl-AMP synthase [Bacteroidetes bacterium]|nr:threonylcarbamoyl-AMP synthase [Bacteroidota bacterium]
MKKDIARALEILKSGGTILFPTDTVWGIGCDSTNPLAVEKVYRIKMRTDNKSMLVLLDDPARIPSYVSEVPEIAWQLIDVSDKPLTLIYHRAKNLAANLINQDGSIGIRITAESFSRELVRRFRKPVVATSANTGGESYPRFFSEISDNIRYSVDYVVKYRQKESIPAKPSAIIRVGEGGLVEIIRK